MFKINNIEAGIHSPAPAGGFTLLEIIVVVAIAGMVVTTAYAVMANTINTTVAMRDRSIPSATAHQVIKTIAADMESALILDARRLAFLATYRSSRDHRVRFLSTSDSRVMPDRRQGDAIEVAYVARPGRIEMEVDGFQKTVDTVSIYRRESPYIDNQPLEGGQWKLLAKNLHRFRLRYFDGTEWRDGWDSLGSEEIERADEGLPQAIEITVAIDKDNVFTTRVQPLHRLFDVEP